MKIQPIRNLFKVTPQVKQQIKDALSVYEYVGLPVFGFIGTDLIKEKYNKQSDFYDKIGV